MVLTYWKYKINKLLQLQFRMIYENLHWLQFMVQQIYLLKDEIYPRLKTTGIEIKQQCAHIKFVKTSKIAVFS